MKDQLATQDYVKTIALLSIKDDQPIVKLTHVSSQLGVSIAAVSDMVKKLVKGGWVTNHVYKGVSLTDSGQALGYKLIRHHRLWEVFLNQTLSVPWSDVHDEAEHLEHAASESLMNRIDAYLGYPKVDPHGNPIPTKSGEMTFHQSERPLHDVPLNEAYTILRFESLDSQYLDYLARFDVALGESIVVTDRFDLDGSMVCSINQKQLQISKIVAGQIYVAPHDA